MSSQTLINGNEPTKEELLAIIDAKGILRGKTPFTTVLISNGSSPFWSEHKERLKKSFEYVFKDFDFSKIERCIDQIKTLTEESSKGLKMLRLTMLPSKGEIVLLSQLSEYKKQSSDSLKLKTCKHPLRESILPSFLKNGNYLEMSLEVEKANKENFDDCLFLDSDDFAAECSTSNIFFRKGSRFFTPSLEGPVLSGITRGTVLRIIKSAGHEVEEINISRPEWESMDEAFLTNSLKGLVSISSIDGREFCEESDFLTQIKKEYQGRLNE